MNKLIIRWVILALVIAALAAVFVRLGEWQLDRLEQRRASNAQMERQRALDPVPYHEVMGSKIDDDEQWQRLEVTGTYDPHQYQVRYRNVDGAPGIEVVAVMTTTQGDRVLIDRGFIPRQSGQPDTDVLPTPPEGEVTVRGYLRRSEQGRDNAIRPHDHRMRLINAPAIAESRGEQLLDGYVQLIESDPANGEELIPVPPQPLSEGNHFSYALQWFAFSVIALVGIVVLIRADLKDRRKIEARKQRRRAAEHV